MIDLPQETVIEKIVSQTELSREEVQEKIKEKLKQLSGLISEDGAAHIIANDLGVQLYKTEGLIKIKEVTTNAKQATVLGKVLQKYELREFDKNGRQGKVANMLIGDETGKIRVVFWNDQVELFEKLNEQDVVQIKNPFVKENNGRVELHLNDKSNLDINPQGVSVSAPSGPQESSERELKYLKDLQGDEDNVEVLGTIVQVYDPRFFPVNPETNRRVSDEDVAAGKPHEWNYVTTVFLDDGTANVRCTFWKNQTQRLFDKSDDEIMKWKDDASLAQDSKHELLGEIVKLVGRVKKNEQFDRIEFTANLVMKDVDPEKELSRIKDANDDPTPSKAPVASENRESTADQEVARPVPEESSADDESDDEPDLSEARANIPEDKVRFDSADSVEPAESSNPDKSADEGEAQNKKEDDSEDKKTDGSDDKKPRSAFKEEVVSIDDLEDL